MQTPLERESSPKGVDFWLATQAKSNDACFPDKNVPRFIDRMCYVHTREEDCSHPFFECPFTNEIWTG